MQTRSEALVETLLVDGHVAYLLPEGSADSEALNEHIDRYYFRERDSLAKQVKRCTWASYSEQKQCLLGLLSHEAFQLRQESPLVYFVPVFGPDETVHTTPQAILDCIDEFLEIDAFVILNTVASIAIIQRRYGIMDLVAGVSVDHSQEE